MADQSFLWRAVNVNAATESVGVLRLETAQPNDARGNGIATRCVWRQNFAGKTTIMKEAADRRVVADFLRDLQIAERSRHSAPKISQAVLGSRNGINGNLSAVL